MSDILETIDLWFAMNPDGPFTDERQIICDAGEEIASLRQRLSAAQATTDRVLECGHTARFTASHFGGDKHGESYCTLCELDTLTARLAAAEALNQPRMSLHAEIARLQKLLDEHAETIKRYREKYEQEREDRQKAEARQYSVGAAHLREYADRVKERDEARQQSENYRTEYLCLFVTNPCGHLGRFMEQGAGCMKCKLAAAEAALQRLMDVQNGPPLIRDKQEWNEAMAEACGVLRSANAMQFYLTAAKGGRDE